jgi:hypothetical protein
MTQDNPVPLPEPSNVDIIKRLYIDTSPRAPYIEEYADARVAQATQPLLVEIERLKKDGPIMQRGTCGDGAPWMGTMRECLEDAYDAAKVEAELRREACAEVKQLRARIKELEKP